MFLFYCNILCCPFYCNNSSVGLDCWFHSTVTLPSVPFYTNFFTWSYNCLLYNFRPISLHMLQCSSAHTVSCLCMYCSFASTVHADMTCSNISSIFFTFYICSLFLFVIFLPHDIQFALPAVVLPLFHFQSLLQISPQQPYHRVFSTNKLSIHTSNVLAMQHFALSTNKLSTHTSNVLPCSTLPSPPTSCLSTLLIYWPCSNLPSRVLFTDCTNFAFTCWMPSFCLMVLT